MSPRIPHPIGRTERPESYPQRFPVPEALVPWDVAFPGYEPPFYDLLGGPIPAEPPLNPAGRTGISGRGDLWFWGANRAADMVLTRLNADALLELLTIIRTDNGLPCTPGGFANIGESQADAAFREGGEEAVREEDLPLIKEVRSQLVHAGFVDDWRNADHAWIVSEFHHWHLPREIGDRVRLRGKGETDDAESAFWDVVSSASIARLRGTHREAVLAMLAGMLADARHIRSATRQQIADVLQAF